MTFVRWIETQSPLWVIYALVIVAIILLGKALFKWLPIVFDKHCTMLDTATAAMSQSATAIKDINDQVEESHSMLLRGHRTLADAAVPACKAIIAMTPPDRQSDVREHLNEVMKILSRDGREH